MTNVRDAINQAVENGECVELAGADLHNANLRDANLRGAELAGADLRRANLCDASLVGADLTGANLFSASLVGADLTDANLAGARLRNAVLDSTSWSGLRLNGLPSGQLTLIPTCDGWNLEVGCWRGTPDGLKELIAQDKGWPEAKGDEIARRRPLLEAALVMCEAHMADNQPTIANLKAMWDNK